jgi:hypothetical protein
MAARQPALLALIWLHALLPGLGAAWVLLGMPGVPGRFRAYSR